MAAVLVFDKAVGDLLQFIEGQLKGLIITTILALPAQKSVQPPSACVSGYDVYLRTNTMRFYLVYLLFISYSITVTLKAHVKLAGGFQSLSAGGKKAARAGMNIAVLFSVVSSGVAVATHSLFLQTSTVVLPCMPPVDQVLIPTFYVLVAAACVVYPAYVFVMSALSSSE